MVAHRFARGGKTWVDAVSDSRVKSRGGDLAVCSEARLLVASDLILRLSWGADI